MHDILWLTENRSYSMKDPRQEACQGVSNPGHLEKIFKTLIKSHEGESFRKDSLLRLFL